MTRSRLAADLWLLKGLDRNVLYCNTCVATNLTIRRTSRRDSAVSHVAGGAAPGIPMQGESCALLHLAKRLLKREFYAEMCRLERWSVRTLRKKIDSLLFERTAVSKKPDELI